MNSKHRRLLELEESTFTADRTGHVIANSPMVKDEILRLTSYDPRRISVVTNGVDIERFRGGDRMRGRKELGLSSEDFVVLLVGRGSFRKGHGFARALEKELSGKIRLRIVDAPPPCAMEDAYAAADVFYLPTLYDPFANATLEAMAAGLPVVTTPNNGVSCLIRDGESGFIVEPGDLAATRAAVRSLMDETRRKQIQEAASEVIAGERLDDKVQAIVNLLEQAIEAK
jgi:UDP-glucose:(heptosyl)LPS alpha-1,3-glucosyltransferase